MYGKFHASAFTGSMRGAGPTRFAVWAYIIAHTNQHSVVELNPEIIGFMIGCSTEEVQEAIDFLCSPDPRSRSKVEEGRRLVKEGEFQYFVPTHEVYRNMKTSEEKKEYNRIKKQEQRERESTDGEDVKPPVKDVKNVNASEASTKAKAESPIPSGWDEFWGLYPKKVAKDQALKAWKKLHPSQDLRATIQADVAERKTSSKWQRGFAPNPATYLNGARWNDDKDAPADSTEPATQAEIDRLEVELTGASIIHEGEFKEQVARMMRFKPKTIAQLRAHFLVPNESPDEIL